jgi:hypothetical protein
MKLGGWSWRKVFLFTSEKIMWTSEETFVWQLNKWICDEIQTTKSQKMDEESQMDMTPGAGSTSRSFAGILELLGLNKRLKHDLYIL